MLILLLASLARASDSLPILVSGFQPATDDAAGMASLLENLLAETLDDEAGVRVVRVEDTPPFEDYGARIYMDGCPRGEAVGCTQILAERGGAAYAVTGTVASLEDGRLRVNVSIVDVTGSRVMVAFQSDLATGGDQGFADGVVKVLLAATRGEIGTQSDIRDEAPEETGPRPSDEELAAQIGELSAELGQVSAVISEPRGTIRKPAYTVADLAAQMEGEGLKPWERVGMTPGGYLRYKNSGLSLDAWRDRAVGRQFELHLRLEGGWWRGPVDSIFYARYAYDPSLTVVDSFSSLQVDTGNGPTVGGEVAFGVLPWLDVGAGAGGGFGHIDVDVSSTTAAATPSRYQSRTVWFGPRVTFAPFPIWRARPLAGIGATVARSPGAAELLAVPPEVSPVDARWVVYAEAYVGGEVELADFIDLYLRVPVDLLVGGEPSGEARTTTIASLVPDPPDADATFATGAIVGVQVRLLGRKARAASLLDDEPE